MRWRRLGRIFQTAGQRDWMQSHTSMPFAEYLDGDRFRIWFAPRDAENRSHVGWLEIDLGAPDRVLRLAERPVLAPGPRGTFDDRGAMPSWLVERADRRLLFYIGWSTAGTVPFRTAIGLASDGGAGGVAFSRTCPGPMLDRAPDDPFFVSTPCVLIEGATWHMWYLSGIGWTGDPSEPAGGATYLIRYACSADGLHWTRAVSPCIDFAHDGESAIARPSVLRDGDLFRMWYCYRGQGFSYRLGYAESHDGLSWRRRDDRAGFKPADEGWDSEMIAYPHVFDHAGSRYMVYAGNGFGRAGMGLAVLEQD